MAFAVLASDSYPILIANQRGSSKDRVLINVIQEWLKSYAG